MAKHETFCCAVHFSKTHFEGFPCRYWKPAVSRFTLRVCSSTAFAQTRQSPVCIPSCLPHMRHSCSAGGHSGRRVQRETDFYDRRRKEGVQMRRQIHNHSTCERRAPFVGLPLPCHSTSAPHFARSVEGIPVLTCLPAENQARGPDSLVSARCSERGRHTTSPCGAQHSVNLGGEQATHTILDLARPQKQKGRTKAGGVSIRPPVEQEARRKKGGRKDRTGKCAAGEGKEAIERTLSYRGPGTVPLFDADEGVTMMELMVKVQVWESLLFNIQRQGRISFYLTCAGEEASLVGSAAALQKEDIILPQYRELPVLLWRGLSLDGVLAQLFGTQADPGKGRQMPVHYATPGINVQPVSSPLGNKITQAAGVGYALKLQGSKALAVVFFGEGAASEGDAAVGLNFAAALQTQTLFICRNNGFAISTPATEQYKGDGIAARAVAYGIDAIRVDGTDINEWILVAQDTSLYWYLGGERSHSFKNNTCLNFFKS